MTRDAHGNPLTDERRRFTSALAVFALGDNLLDWCDVGSYKPGELRTTAVLYRCDGSKDKYASPRNMFRSDTGLERAIRQALNPQTEVEDDDQRIRILLASVHNDPLFLNLSDADLLVRLALLPERTDLR